MKIAFIVEIFPSLSQTFVLNQIAGLIDQGHQVDIYAEVPGDSNKTHPDVEKYQLLKRTYYQPRVPKPKVQRILQGLLLFLSCFLKAPRLTLAAVNVFKYGKYAASLRILYSIQPLLGKQTDYDIIQCHFGLLGRKGMLLRQVGAIEGKLITAFHGVDISQNLRLLGEDAYNDLYIDGDLFQPACEHWQRRLIELGCDPRKIIVHRMGIDPGRFTFAARYIGQDKTVKLVTVARLTEKKGLTYGIRAVAQVYQSYPNLQYDIIGTGDLKSELESLIQELGLKDVVKLLGSKQQTEVFEALRQAHVFLHPSVTAENGDQEASPVSIQEAMATGLPVVSTYHGGIPELVDDGVTGFLVPERDISALTKKLIYLVTHPEEWAVLGQAGRQKIEQQHNIHTLNSNLVRIYEQLLGKEIATVNAQPLQETVVSHPTPANL
ncbi:MAG: colanic acid biosynthesis glycosyltransferase WcaL [Leptolyngbya sp. SIO3F4]|nr:colanic acid biosynthesis glycosyltransferase WcaL [Leptolyngbya sp. SIO3F4]